VSDSKASNTTAGKEALLVAKIVSAAQLLLASGPRPAGMHGLAG
jgi:hypothetical protein